MYMPQIPRIYPCLLNSNGMVCTRAALVATMLFGIDGPVFPFWSTRTTAYNVANVTGVCHSMQGEGKLCALCRSVSPEPYSCIAGNKDSVWDDLRDAQGYTQRLASSFLAHLYGTSSRPLSKSLDLVTWALPLKCLMESVAMEALGSSAKGEPTFFLRICDAPLHLPAMLTPFTVWYTCKYIFMYDQVAECLCRLSLVASVYCIIV
jgi:hypothetical protein